nr:hypothetical protein HEP85_00050 [Streptomyces sp. RPA4-2]
MFDGVLAVAAVEPCLADGGMLGRDLFDEYLAGDGVLQACGGDRHGQEQPDGVDDDAAFAAHDFLAGVDALPVGGAGTLLEVLMLCESMAQALGCAKPDPRADRPAAGPGPGP